MNLTDAERKMLTYALDQAQEEIWSRDGFTDEDQDAVTSLRRLAAETQPTTKPETVSPAYARLQAAAKEATEAAHLHAMRGMRAVYQLCRQYGFGDELIPASEVLAALGLDENANTVEPAAGARQDGAQPQEVVHGCPPPGSGVTPCCGRTPFELPRTDRISTEAPVTCPGNESGDQT